MPVYEYKCEAHGVFNDLATMADSDKPVACMLCGKPSARIIRLPPTLFTMDEKARQAHQINEKNSHEPTFSTNDRRTLDHEHAQGCGSQRKLNGTKLLYTGKGEKTFPSMRPWMTSH